MSRKLLINTGMIAAGFALAFTPLGAIGTMMSAVVIGVFISLIELFVTQQSPHIILWIIIGFVATASSLPFVALKLGKGRNKL